MNDDFKWFILLVSVFVIVPLIGLGVSEWRKQDCRVELSKIGKSLEDINAICK